MKPIENRAYSGSSVRRIVRILLTGSAALFSASNLEAQTTPASQPANICNRACWSARAPQCSITMQSAGSISHAVIHHTASQTTWNTTSQAASAAYLRGHQNYHMDSHGWCDLAYNFCVDKLGNIFEGRSGSISGYPRGGGDVFNTGAQHFTFMGYCHTPYNQAPPTIMRTRIYDTIAWKMPSGWTPYGSASYSSAGTQPRLHGHRSTTSTTCPGDLVQQYIGSNLNSGEMRTSVANRRGSSLVGPSMFYDLGSGAMNIYRWASTGSAFSLLTTTGIASGYSLSNVGNHMASADVNADGKTDNIVAYQYPDGTMRLHVFLNGSAYQGPDGWFQSGAFSLSLVGGRMVGGDFNGDGKGDVTMFKSAGGGLTIYRFLSTGSSFTYDSTVVATSGYSMSNVGENIAAADVNGDGKTDVVAAYQYPDGTMRLHVYLNGNSYQGPGGWFQSGTFTMSAVGGRMAGGDFDGNGKGDILMFKKNGSGVQMFRFLSSGTAFSYDLASIASGYDMNQVGSRLGAGDINGDGKADAVVAYQYPDGTFRYHTFLNGNSYQGPTGWYQTGTFNLANVAGRMTMGKW